MEFGLRQLPSGFLDKVEIAAIGPATADVLERVVSLVSILPASGFSSEELLRQPQLTADPGQALVFTAPGGRQALQKGLKNLGWKVFVAYVYRRVPLDPTKSHLN